MTPTLQSIFPASSARESFISTLSSFIKSILVEDDDHRIELSVERLPEEFVVFRRTEAGMGTEIPVVDSSFSFAASEETALSLSIVFSTVDIRCSNLDAILSGILSSLADVF